MVNRKASNVFGPILSIEFLTTRKELPHMMEAPNKAAFEAKFIFVCFFMLLSPFLNM